MKKRQKGGQAGLKKITERPHPAPRVGTKGVGRKSDQATFLGSALPMQRVASSRSTKEKLRASLPMVGRGPLNSCFSQSLEVTLQRLSGERQESVLLF